MPALPIDGEKNSSTFFLNLQRRSQQISIPGFHSFRLLVAHEWAQVFYAESLKHSQPVVIKIATDILVNDFAALEDFFARYAFFSRLSSTDKSIVGHLGADICDAGPYTVFEYLAGDSLQQRIRSMGAIPPDQAITILTKLAKALFGIHAGHYVHGDIKPENIFFREDGSLVLIDFDLSTPAGSPPVQKDQARGTPFYISPQQGQGLPSDSRDDLYSAGVVLFEMLSGRLPYTGSTPAEIVFHHMHDEIPLLPVHTRSLQPVIDTLLAKDVAQRQQSAGELITALQP